MINNLFSPVLRFLPTPAPASLLSPCDHNKLFIRPDLSVFRNTERSLKIVLVVSRHKRASWPPSQLQLSLKAGDLSDQILGDQAAAIVRIAAKLRRAMSMVLQIGGMSSHDGTEVFFCPQLK